MKEKGEMKFYPPYPLNKLLVLDASGGFLYKKCTSLEILGESFNLILKECYYHLKEFEKFEKLMRNNIKTDFGIHF